MLCCFAAVCCFVFQSFLLECIPIISASLYLKLVCDRGMLVKCIGCSMRESNNVHVMMTYMYACDDDMHACM
jgi:hypothetical protein